MPLPKILLVPIDFSVHSQSALRMATEIALRFGSQLCLVHVVPALPDLPSLSQVFHEGKYEKALEADAEKRLAKMVGEIVHDGITVTQAVGTANDTGMELLRLADHHHADLIVISTHGMTGWRQLAFGSVAEKVVRLATVPVLVLRAQPAPSAA
jgi:nucleotide-binding universal stress UspA family protein